MTQIQHWRIVATPQQRNALCQLIHGENVTLKDGGEGRRLRRFMRALAIMPIRDELVRSGRVDEDQARDDTPAVFEVSAENVEVVRKLLDGAQRKPAVEMAIGDLLDVLDELPGRAPVVPEGIPDYDPSREQWACNGERLSALARLDEAIDGFTAAQIRRLAEFADEIPWPTAPAEKGAQP